MRTLAQLLSVMLFFVTAQSVLAQADPKAKADLLELRQRYEAGKTLEAEVTLEIQFPEQPVEIQKGRIAQTGEKFRVEFDKQVVISNGTTMWMYLPDNKEVQIYDATEGDASGGFLRPQDLLTIYDSDDYEYMVSGEITENGKTYRQIEFKPTNRDSEYAKVRLTYDPVKDEVRRVKVFNKDGSRFTLSLTSVKIGGTIPAEKFNFKASDYPGVSVEDMRL